MYMPEQPTTSPEPQILKVLASLMVNGFIFLGGFELLLWSAGIQTSGFGLIYPGVVDIPIFVFLWILLPLNFIFIVPCFIVSCFYIRSASKGFFWMSLIVNIINFFWVFFLTFFVLIDWTSSYILFYFRG